MVFCACVQEKSRLIKVRDNWWVEQTDKQTLLQFHEVSVRFCALCSRHLSQQISQLLSELEENRGFHFMQQEDDMEEQGTHGRAKSVYKNIPLQVDLSLARF